MIGCWLVGTLARGDVTHQKGWGYVLFFAQFLGKPLALAAGRRQLLGAGGSYASSVWGGAGVVERGYMGRGFWFDRKVGVGYNKGGRGLIFDIRWDRMHVYLCFWTPKFAPRLFWPWGEWPSMSCDP